MPLPSAPSPRCAPRRTGPWAPCRSRRSSTPPSRPCLGHSTCAFDGFWRGTSGDRCRRPDGPIAQPGDPPSFNLTLRGESDVHDLPQDCWKMVRVTVFYGSAILGWGSVPNFCMARHGWVEVNAAMSHTDVMLTDELRRSMASELNSGELEFQICISESYRL
ncbi:hypothetical protein BRADI_2g43052v3 [Brachypodium distachyon]|uniref:Uncharacterized protein n=1 Tax=Brachypodium distachyon TaxID=15368 RepID=A0A0Q3J7W0_BRADI|nr:hypothetical protein BRADI_2g43052v3 [Brachypodium distachyon]